MKGEKVEEAVHQGRASIVIVLTFLEFFSQRTKRGSRLASFPPAHHQKLLAPKSSWCSPHYSAYLRSSMQLQKGRLG